MAKVKKISVSNERVWSKSTKIMKKFAKEFLRKIVNAKNYEIYVIP